ncbi:hypothetical protein [Altererythrobacter aquiaggeris]|uniref:hypothetical protein n=1 Tax=Aestuarierythrobacter aquiaggeris TaxID=1898396 RepID=UPI00301A74D2
MKKALVVFIAALLAAGVYLLFFGGIEQVTQYRVKTALTDAGVGERTADCMARRMTDRLTIEQLRRLETLGAAEGGKLNLGDYVERVRDIGDDKVVTVTATSAGLCAIGLG